jgi:P27 family predicted phage terminase small subunit
MPKSKALQMLHGTMPLKAEVVDELKEEFTPPEKPKHFEKKESEAWDKTVELLRPMMTLRKVDIAVLGAYCSAFVRWQKAEEELSGKNLCVNGMEGPKVNPLVTISRDAQRDMVFYAAQLGMTPASRIKMATGATRVIEKNPWVKLKSLKK